PRSLDQRNANISIQLTQPWGSGADKDGDPTPQLKCCATPRHSRRRTRLGQRVDFPSRTKIDVHAETLSMEFGDAYVKFNIFEALKHLAEDHSIFSIDTIDGLMEEYFQLGTSGASLANFVNISDAIDCFCTMAAKADSEILSNTLHFSYSRESISDLIHCKIDGVFGNSQHAKFLVADTNKQGVKGAMNLIRPKSNFGINFRKANRVKSNSKGRKIAETDSNKQELAETDSTNIKGT
ncbi:hypothetical protein CR513_01235, partial [Mucuna pruriens]